MEHLSKQWKSSKKTGDVIKPQTFIIDQESEIFSAKFNQIQEDLETLASMDELLSGKSAFVNSIDHSMSYVALWLIPIHEAK